MYEFIMSQPITQFMMHFFAAVLWILAVVFSLATGASHEEGDAEAVKVGSVIVIIVAVIAFTLQVMA